MVVNCAVPAATCACASFGTGPHVDERRSHDIEITELVGAEPADEPEYVVEAVSARGAQILDRVASCVATRDVDDRHVRAVEAQRSAASAAIEQTLAGEPIRTVLRGRSDLDAWAEVAERCVACGNCTSVCPTCFCTTNSDVGDLSGRRVERRSVVEVGNLAGANCRAAMRMVAALPGYLLTRDYQWIAFTATSAVRGILQGFGAPLVELARADGSRVASGADQWGTYYRTDPRVFAGYLPASRWIPGFRVDAHGH